MKNICLAAAVLLLAAPVQVAAHGTQGGTEIYGRAACVAAAYDDGTPMSYATVDIFSPAEKSCRFRQAAQTATAISAFGLMRRGAGN